jgi:hypothetical protein
MFLFKPPALAAAVVALLSSARCTQTNLLRTFLASTFTEAKLLRTSIVTNMAASLERSRDTMDLIEDI